MCVLSESAIRLSLVRVCDGSLGDAEPMGTKRVGGGNAADWHASPMMATCHSAVNPMTLRLVSRSLGQISIARAGLLGLVNLAPDLDHTQLIPAQGAESYRCL